MNLLVVDFFLLWMLYVFLFFFFKQKTAYEMRISDWSSDVCSSDLVQISSRDGAARCGDPGRSWRQFRAQRGGEAVGPFFHRGRIGKAVVADLDQCRRNMAIVTVDEDQIGRAHV